MTSVARGAPDRPAVGRRAALIAGGLTVAVLAALAAVSKNRILELWWLRRIRAGDVEEKREAVRRLARLGSRRAVPAILGAAADLEDPALLDEALEEIGPGAGRAVLRSYPELEGRVRPIALQVLGSRPVDPDAIPDLIAAIEDPRFPELREPAIRQLAGLRSAARSAGEALVRVVRSTDGNLHLRALWALRSVDADPALQVPAFREALGDASPEARHEAAYSLGLLGDDARPALPALRKVAAGDPDEDVRKIAAWAVEQVE